MYTVGFAAYPVGFGAYPVGFGAYPVGFGAYPVGLVGLEGKISIGALDIFNGGVKNPMGVLKRVNGGIEKIRRGYCVGSMGALGALVRQWGHWKGSMRHWSRSVRVLKRANGGVGQGQWGYNVSVRVNGGIGGW